MAGDGEPSSSRGEPRGSDLRDPVGRDPGIALGEAEAVWDAVSPAEQRRQALYIEIEGWEGPLDLLLDLARRQKVDLRRISILELVDAYLDYIDTAGEMRLEIAADYLVMAAWLAYLKSSLLLPKEEQPDPSPEEMAMRLQLRLQRLGAMREAAARLMGRDRLGRDVFPRGAPEGLRVEKRNAWQCSWLDLVRAYGDVKLRAQPAVHHVRERMVMSLDSAIARVSAMVGVALDWMELREFVPPSKEDWAHPQLRKSALASSFVAALELAKAGKVELVQESVFGPLQVRALPT